MSAEKKHARSCPFCGSFSFECTSADYTDDYLIFCHECFACGPQEDTGKKAWAAWNHRRRKPAPITGST